MSEPCASGGALSRVPLKMPGQPMTALVHLKDQYSNALVNANEAQMFKMGCERCRWGSRCSDSSALTQDECVSLGRCVGGTVPVEEEDKPGYCESLGSCSIPTSGDGSTIVSEDDCVSLGECSIPGMPRTCLITSHRLLYYFLHSLIESGPLTCRSGGLDQTQCESLGVCSATSACMEEMMSLNREYLCAGAAAAETVTSESDCLTPPGVCRATTQSDAADVASCSAVETEAECGTTMRSVDDTANACEWSLVRPGEWTPELWTPAEWQPAVWEPEIWTPGSATVRYGEYEVFAEGSLVNFVKRVGYYATLTASHNATDYTAVLLKRATCRTDEDDSVDIEVLTQEECCGTGEATECGTCSDASITTRAECEAVGITTQETCSDIITEDVAVCNATRGFVAGGGQCSLSRLDGTTITDRIACQAEGRCRDEDGYSSGLAADHTADCVPTHSIANPDHSTNCAAIATGVDCEDAGGGGRCIFDAGQPASCVATLVAQCNAASDCANEAGCQVNNQDTTPMCVDPGTACAAAGSAPCPDGCSQSATGACVGTADCTLGPGEAAGDCPSVCVYDPRTNDDTCEPIDTAVCAAAAAGDATACTTAGQCTYDDGTSDDVCVTATSAATCTAEAASGEAACTEAGDCTYITVDEATCISLGTCSVATRTTAQACVSPPGSWSVASPKAPAFHFAS